MAKLPTVPSLDPDSPGAAGQPVPAGPSIAAPVVDPAAAHAAAQAAVAAAPAASAPAVSDSEPELDVAIDGLPIDDGAEQDPADPSSPPTVELGESFEEMLSQSSDHTLRLLRVEEGLTNLADIVSDMREEMHAGIADLRSVMQQIRAVQEVSAPKPEHAVGPRIDDLDAYTRHSVGRLRARTFVLVLLQLLILAGVGAGLYLSGGFAGFELTSPATKGAQVSGMPEPKGGLPASYVGATETTEANDEKSAPESKKKKKKR